MRILFYSTNSNFFDGTNTNLETRPFLSEQWENLAEKHTEHKFFIATELPGTFLVDVTGNEIAKKAENVEYFLIQDDDEAKIAEFLSSLKPDMAVAATFYVPPFDWLGVKDAIVAEKLREKGIRTICHPLEAELTCFDKWETHQFFETLAETDKTYHLPKINFARAVHFDHELFINGGNHRGIKSNVYKSAFFEQLKKLRYPAVIKDTTGLSSYGTDVVQSFDEAKNIILSKKTTSSRIIEEMIPGGQFGLEAVRYEETSGSSVLVFPPFKFSVNKWGITSPKQSVKVGPALDEEKYALEDLRLTITAVCEKLKLNGSANFDLVFNESEKKWYVLEINPRLSGMTTTYVACLGKSIPEMLFDIVRNAEEATIESMPLAAAAKQSYQNNNEIDPPTASNEEKSLNSSDKIIFKPTMNIKFPLLTTEKIEKLYSFPFVKFVNQQENLGARQLREKGYAEVIFTGKTFDELRQNLETLKREFKDDMEEIFFNNAINLLESL